MARPRKQMVATDTSKMRDVENYTHDDKKERIIHRYDYLIWYAKKKETTKFHQLYTRRIERTDGGTYNCIELEDGTWRRLSKEELLGNKEIPIL